MSEPALRKPLYTLGESLGTAPPSDGHMPVLDQGSFDIVTFAAGLGPKAVKDWHKGKAAYGVYIDKGIPVILFNLGASWTFEVYLNIHLEAEDSRRRFFEIDPGSPRVDLYLISSEDGVIRAARSTALDTKEMLRIKEACFDQLTRYASKDECFIEAELLLNQADSRTLRRKASMRGFRPGN
jgi:hypothetical protein